MFRVNLVDLDRSGRQEIEGDIAPDSPLWEELDLTLVAPVHVTLVVTATTAGQVWARGEVETVLSKECRRCLEAVEVPVREALDLVWITPDEYGNEEDGELRVLDPQASELDLEPAIREEFLLVVPRFVLCREECRGLCPRCGTNRNHEECECTPEEADPRWDALRSMTRESE